MKKRKNHGHSYTRLYRIWKGMKARCYNPNRLSFGRYGGRGIRVCEEWLDFAGFFKDMNESYSKHANKHGEINTTIDRIDNSKGYAPSNCRWLTKGEQSLNKGDNHLITAFGKTMNLSAWAREVGLERFTLSYRINKLKMKPEDALTKPLRNE